MYGEDAQERQLRSKAKKLLLKIASGKHPEKLTEYREEHRLVLSQLLRLRSSDFQPTVREKTQLS